MMRPPKPQDEPRRLQALRDLDILDTGAEERYDRITRLAQRLFDVPIALVSLVDGDRQWFKSRQGLGAEQTDRDISFCGHAILGSDVFCVPDAAVDVRFADNPLVVGAPNIRFYAGVPLSPDGLNRVGTLCIIDERPHELNAEQLQTLRDLAACIDESLADRRRQQAAQLLAGHENYLRAVLSTVLDGIVTIDEQGVVQSFNRAAETIFGYRAEEVIGQNVKLLMPSPYHDEHDDYLRHYRDTGEARVIGIGREVEGLRKNGERFALDLAVAEMQQDDERHFVGAIKDISRRKQAEAQLEEALQMRQLILDGANVSIISADPQGTIRTFNRAAERMLGYSADEMVGKQSPAIIHDAEEVATRARQLSKLLGREIEPGFEAFVARTADGSADENEWTYVRKDGSRFPVQLSVTRLCDGEGNTTGYLGIASDISERRRIEQLKTEFVATVSHELRTPLTSIRGALGAVLGKAGLELPEKIRRLLDTANRNAERLTLLINDILDLEKIESGHLDFTFNTIDLLELCQTGLTANEGYARQHGVRLRLVEAPAHARVLADAHRLLQALTNLLSNAVKYSPTDGVVELSVRGSAGGQWRVGVRDHGPGIPAAFRARLFERFAQADGSDARAKGGTGLGLSITKAIVERHGGSLGYDTEEGVGTEFHFELPDAELRLSSPQDAPRLLICEDNPDVAFVLGELVQQQGFAYDTAPTAGSAQDLLAARDYVALLLDLALPDADGLNLIATLRQNEHTRHLPIVVVSGTAEEGRRAWHGDALAVIDWLQKPVDRDRLALALEQARQRTQRPRILHVEDEPDVIQVIAALAEGWADYEYARSLVEAERKLADAHYDVLILDAGLPDGCGLQLLDRVPPDCQVLLFSGAAIDPALTAGVAAVLTKGTTSSDRLVATIQHLLADRKRPHE